jgi:hypothetical protein
MLPRTQVDRGGSRLSREHQRRTVIGARSMLMALGALLLGGLGALTIGSPASASDPALTLGLQRSTVDGPCDGYGYEVELTGGGTACTHGPDPAPAGIDLASPRTLDQLRDDLAATDRLMPELAGGSAAGSVEATAAAGGIPCVGYGSAGPRVQAIYAHLNTAPSRYGEVAPLIRGWARQTDDIFDASAGQTTGSRHLRWVHDTHCTLAVARIALSQNAAVNINQMMNELAAAGYNRSDRRYLVWFDTDVLCGIAVNVPDDRPGQDNPNNASLPGITHFGRVDTPCWGVPAPENQVEAHEIMHTLGAVQFSSPNTSSVSRYEIYGHCTDEYDTMCYEGDGSPKPIRYVCPAANERFFDCRHDDYFHTNPRAGSYLATHWNSAMSRFLTRVDPVAGFLDVSSSPFREDIRWIGTSGITKGCTPDGERYCEGAVVTRGQMASFLARALALPAATRDFFDDDETSVHEADINRVAQAHIATGCGAGRFCPERAVTREQMASFLARARGLPAANRDYFTDDERSVHEADINRLAAAGIASGCGDGRYCPTQTVTRGQMAAFLRRAFS